MTRAFFIETLQKIPEMSICLNEAYLRLFA